MMHTVQEAAVGEVSRLSAVTSDAVSLGFQITCFCVAAGAIDLRP